MPTFLFPAATAGLLALLALAVPLAIHLWNRRPGRTVRVGSVRWLQAAANRRLRNLRLEQLALLLLRAAIVALLALAVAGPQWQRQLPVQPVRGLVLLAPEVLRPEVLPALRPTVDSLRRRGYELRLFGRSFPALHPTTWAQPDSLALLVPPASTALVDDYWLRARQAADSFPGRPLHVLSGAALPHFRGARPALPARLRWQLVPPPTSATWLVQAYQPHPDSLRLLVGNSHETATTFRVVRMAGPRVAGPLAVPGLPGLQYRPGRPATLRLPGQPAVQIQTTPLRVALYADASHAAAGRYLRAALRALSPGLPQVLELPAAPAPATSFTARPDWLFWLSDEPVPAAWLTQVRRGSSLWQETTALGAPLAARLSTAGLLSETTIDVLRLDTGRTAAAQTVVWQTGAGQPVLLRQPLGRGSRYQLRTRLHPAWTSLPESPVLPTLLLQLLRAELPDSLFVAQPSPPDMRQLDARQLGAAATSPAANRPLAQLRPPPQLLELRPWVVLAALLLFALERWLAYRRSAVSFSSSAV